MGLTAGFAAVAVDMPIGLPPRGVKRSCDAGARRLLGRRASCLFAAPPRESLAVTDYGVLRTWGMSKQTFYLLPRVREVDACLTPALQERYFEAHPELIFAAWNGGVPMERKSVAAGLAQRAAALPWVPELAPRGAAMHDVLDALALLECARGERRRVAGPEERDERGLRMEIWY